jgi:hypothetical protein
MNGVKASVFTLNRSAFRRFELTGDILEVGDEYELVEE